jgi:hypothetical protein
VRPDFVNLGPAVLLQQQFLWCYPALYICEQLGCDEAAKTSPVATEMSRRTVENRNGFFHS